LGVGSSRRVEHVAFSRVGECLGACASVRLCDSAGDEGTRVSFGFFIDENGRVSVWAETIDRGDRSVIGRF